MGQTPSIDPQSARLVLSELQRQHDTHVQAIDHLNGRITSLLEWASLALSVVTALHFDTIMKPSATTVIGLLMPEHIVPVILAIASAGLYFSIVALGLKTLRPVDYELPLTTNWSVLCDAYLIQPEQEAVEQLISQYLGILDRNDAIENAKARAIESGFRRFAWMIGVLTLLATHPLWQGLVP